MKCSETGQSLTETLLLAVCIATGALSLLAYCNDKIRNFIDLLLSLIASPVP